MKSLLENEKNDYGKGSKNQDAALTKMRTLKMCAKNQINRKQD